MSRSLILDFDASVRPPPDAVVVPLNESQEAIRFGCPMPVLRALGRQLAPALDATSPATVFLGSGDYHHVSYLLIERLRALGARLQIVVFDNHPDNMRYPFGIHCGSWVWHVSRLPFVARVHVVGITSGDVKSGHLWENHLLPLVSGKVRYWCVQKKSRLPIRHRRSFASMASLLEAFGNAMSALAEPVYLSIDKDVLAADVVHTNWDQGVMRLEELTAAIRLFQGRLVGSDVTGDVSSYRYRGRFKRLLSVLDRQPAIPAQLLEQWQSRHQEVNRELLSVLGSLTT